MYTIKTSGGGRDLRIERGPSSLESAFARIRRDVIEPRLALGEEDRVLFLAFLAAMKGRTTRQRDHWQRMWRDVKAQGEKIREAVMRMPPERRSNSRANAIAMRSPHSIGLSTRPASPLKNLHQAILVDVRHPL